jgi:hypothetical protein
MGKNHKDIIWDEMSQARDIKVTSVIADSDSVRYRVTFDMEFDGATHNHFLQVAKKQGYSITAFLRRYARYGIKMFLCGDRDDNAASDDRVNGTTSLPASI